MNVTQNVDTGSAAILSFDVVTGAGNGWPAPTAPVTEIAMPFAGLVLVTAYDLDWGDSVTGNSVGDRRITTRMNNDAGTIRAASIMPSTNSAVASVQSFSRVFRVTPGNTIAIRVIQDSAQTLAVAMCDVFLQYTQLGSVPAFAGTN